MPLTNHHRIESIQRKRFKSFVIRFQLTSQKMIVINGVTKMTAVSVFENLGMHEKISEMLADPQKRTRAAQALFSENKRIEGVLNGD